MPSSHQPSLFVVDGSNLATEGRSQPSLEQLNEAVMAFIEEFPDIEVTVVVDATFGHRIAKKEVEAFDEAVANNELVTPPAGAIGRGDAFVLSIANKAKAGVLSNDSFQEFHGQYEWLFDEGRLVGGKPVPHVGWVWVERTPVRGPKSRQAVKEAKSGSRTRSKKSDAPTSDPQEAKQTANRRVRKKSAATVDAPVHATGPDAPTAMAESADDTAPERSTDAAGKGQVNELMPFLDFVERHPVGTSCTAVVESYASHGAYARMDDVLIYIPLRMMDDPAPRSARSALAIGDSIAVVVVGFTPARRSIDAALPHVAAAYLPSDAVRSASDAPTEQAAPVQRAGARKATAKKSAAKRAPAKSAAAKKAPAEKAAAKKTPARKTPARKAAAKTTPAKKTPAKTTASAKSAAASTAPAGKTPAKKNAARKAPAEKAAAKKAPARKTAARKAPAEKTPAAKTTARKTGARKTAAKKSAAASRSTTESSSS